MRSFAFIARFALAGTTTPSKGLSLKFDIVKKLCYGEHYMKSLNVELFNPARPEHGQDVTLTITHNGHTPDKAGELEVYIWHCEYGAQMTITDNEGGEACYMITSDTAIANDTYQELIASLKSRIVELFGGWA